MTAGTAGTAEADSPRRGKWRRWLAEHRPFLIALALGVLMRVLVFVAFPPAVILSDGPRYLSFLETLSPDPHRPVGYGLLLLYPLSWVTEQVLAVTAAQHLLGLVTAVLLYVLLRRWGVGRRVAMLATLPVLFDGMQLFLEQSVLSDTLFIFVMSLGLLVLCWHRRPTLALALAAGLLLGTSATVRQVGLPLVLAAVAYCLLAGNRWRSRLATAGVLAIGFAAPVGSYMAWYHAEHGAYGLSELGPRAAYMRTTPFVDCSGLPVPDYQRVLCPPEPRGERHDPTYYGWDDDRTLPRLEPPPGTGDNEALSEFAAAAIREQPVDYARVVVRDLALNFDLWRANRFEYDTAQRWRFSSYLTEEPTERIRETYAEHGGDQLSVRQPVGWFLAGYQWVVYLPGPLLLGCAAIGLSAGFGARGARHSGLRSICLLMTVTGLGLILAPVITTQFVWRYQLPALVLLPAGAALGYTALRATRERGDGTVATPSTD